MNKRKRIFVLTALVTIFTIFGITPAYAALEVVETYPTDGFHSALTMNMIVKISFDKEIDEAAAEAANGSMIKLTDENGEVIETMILCQNTEDIHTLNVLPNSELLGNTEYTLTISKDLSLEAGTDEALGKDIVVTFKTRDPSNDNKITMGLMAGMIALMVGITAFQTNRQMKKQETDEKVNPYKVAKEKGISVDKVIEKNQKQQNAKLKKVQKSYKGAESQNNNKSNKNSGGNKKKKKK